MPRGWPEGDSFLLEGDTEMTSYARSTQTLLSHLHPTSWATGFGGLYVSFWTN